MDTTEITVDTRYRQIADLRDAVIGFCHGHRAGRPQLGTWQSIVLVDVNADNPTRRVGLSFLAG